MYYNVDSKPTYLFREDIFSLASKNFVAIDIETTGLDASRDRIVEISAIRYINCIKADVFHTLVNPQVTIPYEAKQIHGIGNFKVLFAPTIKDTIPKLLKFLGNSLIAAHNARFDIAFIEFAAKRQGFNPQFTFIDTVTVAKEVLYDLENYKLGTVLEALGKKPKRKHRAFEDSQGCAEIVLHALDTWLKTDETVKCYNAYNLRNAEVLFCTYLNKYPKIDKVAPDYWFTSYRLDTEKTKEKFINLGLLSICNDKFVLLDKGKELLDTGDFLWFFHRDKDKNFIGISEAMEVKAEHPDFSENDVVEFVLSQRE